MKSSEKYAVKNGQSKDQMQEMEMQKDRAMQEMAVGMREVFQKKVTEKLRGDEAVLFAGTDLDHAGLLALGDELLKLTGKKGKKAVLVSDCAVYGKSFGEQRSRNEHELGYVSHTSRTEMSVQNLRMAEHLACRLAREDGLNIKVVRVEQYTDAAAEAVLVVLRHGVCAEIYNLPCGREPEAEVQMRSPLSPMKNSGDAEKYLRLCRACTENG